jgi:hypothetical protein
MACKQIPCGVKQGIFSAEQGILSREQGSGANEQRIADCSTGSLCVRSSLATPMRRQHAWQSITVDILHDRPFVECTVAQPFSDPRGIGVINAEPCPRELGREIPAPHRRIVLLPACSHPL